MKRISKIFGLIAVGAITTPAVAMEVSGGDVNLKYSTFDQKIFDMVLSRLRSGLSTHLCGLSFESQGAFTAQR